MAMNKADKLKLLKTLYLLEGIPKDQLETLGEFLNPVTFEDGKTVFAEGTKGDSLFFVSSGQIRISKQVKGQPPKDLAILGPGDCFGEMALIEDVPRSASATAFGKTVLFQLGRKDLNAWLKSHPDLAMGFFAEMVQVQSRRLRRTSSELTLLFDLSNLLLEPIASGKELLAAVIEHVIPHLQGTWSSAGYIYNQFNDEMDFAAGRGDFDFAALAGKLAPATETHNLWIDDTTYYVSLPGEKRPLGNLVFHSHSPLDKAARTETGRTLATMGRLIATALNNIDFRTEEILRARLKTSNQTYGAGL